jgi:DNA-binding response OmpR family regulator
MKILVVEDDQNIAQVLGLLLATYGYAVDIAEDGQAGLQMAEAFEYDLVVLDVILPKLDGISLCRQLRTRQQQMPILLLTGQGTGHQKAIALNAGADDYVVKPFDSEELIARIQALLRRGSTVAPPLLEWGYLQLSPENKRATYGSESLSLTPKEYTLLELFLRHSQRPLSAEMILNHAWSSLESPGSEAVRAHIKELRKKLKQVGAPPDLIKTVYGTGYQLNPLYLSNFLASLDQSPTGSEIVDLRAENEALRTALEQLQRQHHELAIAHLSLEQQHLPAATQLKITPLPEPQSLENFDTLIGGIAHDLNNLLMPILLTAQVLQKNEISAAQKQELLELLASHARQGGDLVRKMLTVAKQTTADLIPLNSTHSASRDPGQGR